MSSKTSYITAVVANEEGEIFDIDGYAAVGMCGDTLIPLTKDDTVSIPFGSELMRLPNRTPILYNIETGDFELVEENPFVPGENIYPVGAFNSPGYVLSSTAAYEEDEGAEYLPLFSYGAVGWLGDGFRSAVVLVDTEDRQDLRKMPEGKIAEGVEKVYEKMPENRLREHIENCALVYGCPAAKNFFLGRYEAPLPTSRTCNARCLGCISEQKSGKISNCQNRIEFTPKPEEIAEIALEHISNVEKSVVSFGQGCEGDPLLASDVIEPAIKIIRSETDSGTINMNTNGSLPDTMERLFDAGLDSIRVSMNSVRKDFYNAYFRPNGYNYEDVIKSIDLAISKGKFVAINYLNSPGFTDSPEEFEALLEFLESHPVNLIQWRNLNFDPKRYWEKMCEISGHSEALGMDSIIETLKIRFPKLMHGYFNPPKEKFL